MQNVAGSKQFMMPLAKIPNQTKQSKGPLEARFFFDCFAHFQNFALHFVISSCSVFDRNPYKQTKSEFLEELVLKECFSFEIENNVMLLRTFSGFWFEIVCLRLSLTILATPTVAAHRACDCQSRF